MTLTQPQGQGPTPRVLQPRGQLPLLNVWGMTRLGPRPPRPPPAVNYQEGLVLFFQHPTWLPPILLCPWDKPGKDAAPMLSKSQSHNCLQSNPSLLSFLLAYLWALFRLDLGLSRSVGTGLGYRSPCAHCCLAQSFPLGL